MAGERQVDGLRPRACGPTGPWDRLGRPCSARRFTEPSRRVATVPGGGTWVEEDSNVISIGDLDQLLIEGHFLEELHGSAPASTCCMMCLLLALTITMRRRESDKAAAMQDSKAEARRRSVKEGARKGSSEALRRMYTRTQLASIQAQAARRARHVHVLGPLHHRRC